MKNNLIIVPFRWLIKNIRTLLFALILGIFVWVSAVIAADPNEQRVYPQPIRIEIFGQNTDLIIINNITDTAEISIKAPRSIWTKLEADPDLIRVWADLTGLPAGKHLVPIKTQIRLSPLQIIEIDPEVVELVLEPRKVESLPVQVITNGEPGLGYRIGTVISVPGQVTISGPATIMERVKKIEAILDITGAKENIKKILPLIAVDENGGTIDGVSIIPQSVTISQDIVLMGGYRNVVVKVITNGQLAEGYWLTNISVTPPNVTVFSSNPDLVESLPGYVETEPVDLTNLSDDVDIRATLNLKNGVELAGEESVLVRLSIAALEGSLPIELPIVVVGLSPEYSISISPEKVNVLITGPLPLLNNLKPEGIRVSIDVSGLEPGVNQVKPFVDLLPNQVQVASILPENVEITIVKKAIIPSTSTLIPTPIATPKP